MATRIHLRRTVHLLLTPAQIPISSRELLQLLLTRHLYPTIRIHADYGVLVEEEGVEDDAQFADPLFVEEEEAAVGFVVSHILTALILL